MTEIPKSHPRYLSLVTRERLVEMMRRGIVSEAGLIAHGRGEAFDYLIGEKSNDFAIKSEKAAVATMLLAERPVISVNGNAAALSGKEIIGLGEILNAKIEVNLFHRTEDRVKKIVEYLESLGGRNILGPDPDARIPGLDHARALCHKEGIYSADVVLVPLEDGDRAQALKNMGKTVITIDLNPISRTARASDITIVDNIIRAIPNMISFSKDMKNLSIDDLKKVVKSYDNADILKEALNAISENAINEWETQNRK